jgi:hypothetical protein
VGIEDADDCRIRVDTLDLAVHILSLRTRLGDVNRSCLGFGEAAPSQYPGQPQNSRLATTSAYADSTLVDVCKNMVVPFWELLTYATNICSLALASRNNPRYLCVAFRLIVREFLLRGKQR